RTPHVHPPLNPASPTVRIALSKLAITAQGINGSTMAATQNLSQSISGSTCLCLESAPPRASYNCCWAKSTAQEDSLGAATSASRLRVGCTKRAGDLIMQQQFGKSWGLNEGRSEEHTSELQSR